MASISKIMLLPYRNGSKTLARLAEDLSQYLPTKRLLLQKQSTLSLGSQHLILNYGSTAIPPRLFIGKSLFLNKPPAVSLASAKLRAFEKLSGAGVSTVPWTTDKEVACQWHQEGGKIYIRNLTQASAGKGIVIGNPYDFPTSPLYTRGYNPPAYGEYRIHVFNGRVIDVAKKKRMSSEVLQEKGITLNEEVRSHDNGWVFCREGVDVSLEYRQTAVNAISALGLDFGAVDLLGTRSGPRVLEVNSAPGMEGTTLLRYSEAIRDLIAEINSNA